MPARASEPPNLSGSYRIERELGRGGMATVYEAADLRHGRTVAVKVIHPELAAAIGRARFAREIAIVARLSHPHIVPLFDSGERDGALFYVMPLVAGETLRARLARDGALPLDEALRLARELAAALGYAHRQGVVHRDVKPENVLLSDGIALLSDFGIALAGGDAGAALPTAAATAPGWLLGTPAYMSPEQITGGEVTGATDVYALACVLFEMLSGRPPFVAPTADAVLRAHCTADPPALDALREDVPEAVAREVARGLAKSGADRHETAARFAEALALARAGAAWGDAPSALRAGGAGAGVGADGGAGAVRSNLPPERTRFVGRAAELARGRELLGATRLLTLTGIGGAGKTRLALKFAESALSDFPGGVAFVDLAPVLDPTRVDAALAEALGVKDEASVAPLDAALARLGGETTLVVLDNCEHVVDAVAALANALLARSPSVRILATSREGLGVDGELVWAVRSLGVPPAGAGDDPAAIEASEAARLFVERARAADPGFTLGAENAAAVAEICRRLDGIPLALELAAARVRLLSVDQIRARLDDRFRLLTGSGRGALARHQTLEATIRWSADTLAPEDQRRFRALAVFQGGWTLEAAVAVATGEDGDDEFALLEALSRMVDKSLVVVDRDGAGEPRYRMLETVRQFARDRLVEAGEVEAASRRHARACLELAEAAYENRFEREERWLDRLERELDNLRAALAFLRDDDAEAFLLLAGTLAWFWYARSRLREGGAFVEAALAATPAAPARTARARGLWGAALLGSWQGRTDAAIAFMREATAMYRALGDAGETALALEGLGWTLFLASREAESTAAFEEAFALQGERGDPYLLNRARVGLGQALVAEGQTARARALAEEVVAVSEAQGDARSEHFGHHFLADCELIEERFTGALAAYRRSLELAASIGDRIEIGFEVQGVAMSLAGLGDAESAVRLGTAVDVEFARIGADIRVRFWDALVERHIAGARRALAPERREALERAGRALTFEHAVEEALRLAAGQR